MIINLIILNFETLAFVFKSEQKDFKEIINVQII